MTLHGNDQPDGVTSMQSGIIRSGIAATTIAFVAMMATPSQAYTGDQQQLCTDDAFRLCGSVIPDVDRVTACMIRNQSMLSPGCAQFFRAPAAQATPSIARKASRPRAAKKKKAG
jgi:hypothetical protein